MLGVSVETLRRWETEGRLEMQRSEGGQRLVDLDQVRRLLDERRKASTDRPIVAQSARNRFPGIVTRIDCGSCRRSRGGHRRTASACQPDDRGSRPRPRPQGRRRGGLRRQGDERHRRDPVIEGIARMNARLAAVIAILTVVLAACIGAGTSPSASTARLGSSVDGGLRRTIDGSRWGADHLRRGLAQGGLGQGRGRLRGGEPRHDADDLDRLVVRPGDPDRARGAG